MFSRTLLFGILVDREIKMDKPFFRLVGSPCGQHGQYTFYKALRLTGSKEKIIAIGDFFFVRIWQDCELVSIGELQLLWTDRVSDQTLVSLRLYFLPENTPDGRSLHGEDEVLAINDKVVLRAEDLLSWICDGEGWRWGLRAVWRGACAPPADLRHTQPLHHTKLDFSDVEREKNSIATDADSPGVVVFSYPRYCRYRALLSRLEGIQADWLRDSLVAALGGYAAPTNNTRILYCKDTFEYPELEGHEFVCNHLAPRLKGRPRGRRRRAARSRSHSPSPSSRSSDSDQQSGNPEPDTPRRLSLRNGADRNSDDENEYRRQETPEDRAFVNQLRQFYRDRNETFKEHALKDVTPLALYRGVCSRGGYRAVCRRELWPRLLPRPALARRYYERYLLPFETYERKLNGSTENIPTIEVADSPQHSPSKKPLDRTRVIDVDDETGEVKDVPDCPATSQPAEVLNREFLDSLDADRRAAKINVVPVEKLKDEKCAVINNNVHLPNTSSNAEQTIVRTNPVTTEPVVNGHADNGPQKTVRPLGKSSLRAVRVKATRPHAQPASAPPSLLRGSPPAAGLNNFGIHRPPPAPRRAPRSDDEIVEVPYKPKSPEIIDLDEYPESPQTFKKKKLEILKERGLEVTVLPAGPWPVLAPVAAVQHLGYPRPAQLYQVFGAGPPKVIQSTSPFGSDGPQKTVYGNPKDPFMPPPHVLQGAPVRPQRAPPAPHEPPHVLDLTCKLGSPAGSAVRVDSDLEITLLEDTNASQKRPALRPPCGADGAVGYSYKDPYAAFYNSLAGSVDQRQLAMYRELVSTQFRGYGLAGLAPGHVPTSK